jgi:hypothetical protein
MVTTQQRGKKSRGKAPPVKVKSTKTAKAKAPKRKSKAPTSPAVIKTATVAEVNEIPNKAALPLAKPTAKFRLSDHATEQDPVGPGLKEGIPVLPMVPLGAIGDLFLLHPDPEFTSKEGAFINVPTEGSKESTLHWIDSRLVKKYLQLQGKAKWFRITLGTRPDNHFFLLMSNSRNLTNKYNETALPIITQAKSGVWTTVTTDTVKGIYVRGEAENNEKFSKSHPTNWQHFGTYDLDEFFDAAIGGRLIQMEDEFGPEMDRLLGRQ